MLIYIYICIPAIHIIIIVTLLILFCLCRNVSSATTAPGPVAQTAGPCESVIAFDAVNIY